MRLAIKPHELSSVFSAEGRRVFLIGHGIVSAWRKGVFSRLDIMEA